MKPILDVACGSRMFYHDKENSNVLFVDKRTYYEKLDSGHTINVNPDIVADFTNLPFEDNSFYHVVFDPPHLLKVGENAWMAKKYGKLSDDWPAVIEKGFKECFRVLKPNGTLMFKWNDYDIPHKEVLKLAGRQAVYGDKKSKTRWTCFIKEGDEEE